MTYLLDTNVISDLMRASTRTEAWIAGLDETDRSSWPRSTVKRSLSERMISTQLIKVVRQQRGLLLDENDLWIAATALALDATLVSRDNDFSGIDGLLLLVLGTRF